MKQISRPTTAAEIIEIVGPLDDAVLMRILETQAVRAEVLEAFTWASADDQIGTELEHGLRGVVAGFMTSSSARNWNRTNANRRRAINTTNGNAPCICVNSRMPVISRSRSALSSANRRRYALTEAAVRLSSTI